LPARMKKATGRRPAPTAVHSPRTIFVGGSDTGAGKTYVLGTLALLLAEAGARVHLVKPVETGVLDGESGDVANALKFARSHLGARAQERLSGETLVTFEAAMAPVDAADKRGKKLSFKALVDGVTNGPECDWRLVEGAGGLAVPLNADASQDWASFASEIGAERVVCVVPDRLGAINQARLTYFYAQQRQLNSGVWLNSLGSGGNGVRQINRQALRRAGVPIWAVQDFTEARPWQIEAAWLKEAAQGSATVS